MANSSIGRTLGIEIDEATQEDLNQKKTLKLPPPEEKIEDQIQAKLKSDD